MVLRDFFILIFFLFTSLYANNKSPKELEKVTLQLEWKYQFEFAGFIAAYEKGFYKDMGLDVEIKEYHHGINVIKDVLKGKANYGIHNSSLIITRTKDKPVVLLANYFKRSPLVLVAKTDIVHPADLIGKKIMAMKDEIKNSSLGLMLNHFNITNKDINIIKHSFDSKDFINGKVDAMTVFTSNELYYLNKENIKYNIINPVNYGFYSTSCNLFTSENEAKNHKERTLKFIKASNKGWEYALKNQDEIIQIIYNKYSKQKSIDALVYEAKETKSLMMPKLYDIGSINQDLIKHLAKQLAKAGIINEDYNLNGFIFSAIEKNKKIKLTKSQKEYLKEKRIIKMCNNPNWAPIEFKKANHNIQGIAIDTLKLIEEELDIKFKHIHTTSWSQSQQFLKEKKCDILPAAIKTASRSKYANFTKPYLKYDLAIITKNDKPFVSDLESIIDKPMSRKKGSGLISKLKTKYPNINIIETSGYKESLQKVSSGEVYFTIATLPVASYFISKFALYDLHIAGYTNMKYNLSIAVRNDDQVLLSILNSALDSISLKTKNEIFNKWASVNLKEEFDYSLLWKILGFIFIVALFLIYRQSLLKKQNQKLKQIQEQLQDSLGEFEHLINTTMEAIIISENSICIDINNEGLKIFGFRNKEEAIGANILDFIAPQSYRIVKEKLQQTTSKPYEANIIKKDGTVFPSLVQGHTFKTKSKAIRITTLLDLTDLKNKEQLLIKQSKMAALGEMIGNIAHQWRQPLNTISVAASGMKMQKEFGTLTDDSFVESIDGIVRSSQFLSKTIDDFRDFLKEDKQKIKFTLNQSIQKDLVFLEGALKSADINIIEKHEEEIELYGYQNELTQAILNIINNAKDALQGKEFKEDKYIFIDTYKKNNKAIIKIKDNGGGIPEDLIDKIFEPYFTTKHKSQGTGLGLYMTHKIIDTSMGGTISAKNSSFIYNDKKYTGAQFTIELPLGNP